MIVRKMQPIEFDATMGIWNYYRDEAIEALPRIAEEYDENSAIDTVRNFATQWDHCWFNAYEGSRPVGFIAGYASESPWNKNIITANIAFIFMLKSHRNMENFRQLLTKFEEWAHLVQARDITAGDIGIDPERSQKLYEYFDFKTALWMVKEIGQ
jgi:hypothetical protein